MGSVLKEHDQKSRGMSIEIIINQIYKNTFDLIQTKIHNGARI